VSTAADATNRKKGPTKWKGKTKQKSEIGWSQRPTKLGRTPPTSLWKFGLALAVENYP